jgi:YHS domain-containing protein/plastocyanin
MRQWIAVLLLAVVALIAAPAHAHDVKDPVCRMTVDSDTAKFKHKLGNKSFYFCSKACQTKFATTPEKYEKLADQLEKQDLHEYTVGLKTSEAPVAGKPVTLEVDIRYADTQEPVREFELVHERLLHFIMTTEDMSWFEHQHPVRGDDGIFRLTWTFPRPGSYRLYADFTPADGDNQVKPLPFTVGGGSDSTFPLRADTRFKKEVGDLRFELQVRPGLPLRMEKAALLTYTVRDRSGRLVTDIQPYIGAMGHLLALSEDGKEFVHTHVLQTTSQSMELGRPHVSPAMISATGPVFSFMLTLPTGGLYKTWAQFMHGNRVYTVPFTFQVADLWSSPAPVVKAGANPRVQRATVVVDGEYQPARVSVKAGQPVELTFIRKEKSGCGSVVEIPSLKLKRTLGVGRKTTIAFTPAKRGKLVFSCGMGMYQGEILVR